jgi:hypothetical protein
MGAELHPCRQRHRQQPGVLTGEEHLVEHRVGFGDDRHSAAPGNAQAEKAPRQTLRGRHEIVVAERVLELAATVVEIDAGLSFSGVLEGFHQIAEAGTPVGQRPVSARAMQSCCLQF